MTGAIAPSGSRLGRALSRHVASPDARPRAILEVGPGTGAVTRHIAARLRPGDRLDLPFANFPVDTVRTIFDQLLGALKPGGRLSFFGYAGAGAVQLLSPSRAETRGVLRDIVVRHQVGRELVTRNLPPAWVHHLSAEKFEKGA